MSAAVAGWRLAADGALAHDVNAQRVVRDLRRDIDGARLPLQRVEEFGEALPVVFQSFCERDAGDVLDRLHEVDQLLAMLLAHRREADAAIAEHDRGDAVPGGRRQHRVPGRLAVIVGVHVDPAGGDQQSVGIDLALARPGLAADRGDAAIVDGDIAAERRLAAAVDDLAATDHGVVHRSLPEYDDRNLWRK
jgi:hypothetical protein